VIVRARRAIDALTSGFHGGGLEVVMLDMVA
jgi:hypothetical protein